MQSLGAPVLIHCGTTAIGAGEPGGLGFKLGYARPIPNIDDVAADFPRLNIVAAHPGWPWTDELIAVAIHKANVSIDISGWGPKYIPEALKHDMQRRLQDKVPFGSDYPGWSAAQCCDEWEMAGFRPGIIEKLFHQNAIRILRLQDAVARAAAADAAPQELRRKRSTVARLITPTRYVRVTRQTAITTDLKRRPIVRTQVGIIGAGPAGLFLSHLLHRAGITAVNLESRTRADVQGTVRAGVLEHWVTDLMTEMGLGDRMRQQGHFHDGITLQWNNERHHLDIQDLTNGKRVTVYPQHEVLIDLIAACLADGGDIIFNVGGTTIHGPDTDTPRIDFRRDKTGVLESLHCDYIVGADGFHGPGRQSIPSALRTEYQKIYPFGWLGILTQAPLSWHELIYANQDQGFALLSTRSPDVQRMYIQCDPADDIANWSDGRIWQQLHARLGTEGWTLTEGAILRKGIIPLRSFVCEPMQYGRLFIAGDAAHIVPPTGAKGLNLAVADVLILSRALQAKYHDNRQDLLDRYSATCLRRVWKGERFSWYMTTMLHKNDQETAFEQRIHLADLDLVRTSRAAACALAENYVGLPFD